jgi:hypothetical protein
MEEREMSEFPRGKQIATMACGIASIVLACGYGVGFVPAIVALVFASQAKKVNDTSKMVKTGKICAIIGLILSIIMLIIYIFVIGVGVAAGMGSY